MKTTLNTSFVTGAMQTEALLAYTSATLYEVGAVKRSMEGLRTYNLILMNTDEYGDNDDYSELVCSVSHTIQHIEQCIVDGADSAELFEPAQTLYEDISELNKLVGGK